MKVSILKFYELYGLKLIVPVYTMSCQNMLKRNSHQKGSLESQLPIFLVFYCSHMLEIL